MGRELLCVLAVIRHGDRTPKHKLKLTVRPTDCFLPIMGTSLTALLGNTSQSSVGIEFPCGGGGVYSHRCISCCDDVIVAVDSVSSISLSVRA